MDYATVLQIGVAIAMLCVLLAALWPKLSCQLSASEQQNLPSSRSRSLSTHTRAKSGRYVERVRHSYERLVGHWPYSEKPIEPTEQEEGPVDGDKAA